MPTVKIEVSFIAERQLAHLWFLPLEWESCCPTLRVSTKSSNQGNRNI